MSAARRSGGGADARDIEYDEGGSEAAVRHQGATPTHPSGPHHDRVRRQCLRAGSVRLACVVLTAIIGRGCWKPATVESPQRDPATAIYAAPAGSSGGDGSRQRPFDLATALSGGGPLRPGGTVWLRGGIYRVAPITSMLTGAEGQPITVRPVPGEQVVLDGADVDGAVLTINGAWTVYRDFEITSSETWRSGQQLARAQGVDVHGAHVKVVNLVVHDLATGFGIWSDAVDTEAYGNIVYYNGWMGPDRPHGHGIYTQNKTGVRRLTDNIVFGQFGIGIHAYASDEGFLDDIQLEGNVVASNGLPGSDYSILLGGHRLAKRPVLKSNFTYDNPGAGNNVGFASGCESADITDNYFAVPHGGYAVQLMNCTGVVKGNVLTGVSRAVDGTRIVPQQELAAQYPANHFQIEPSGPTRTFVRPNRYTPGRAHVIVYNWEHGKEVRVDLAPAGVAVGAAYEIRDVRNLPSVPVLSGVYTGGAVRIPLEGLTAAPMVGWSTPPHWSPEFAVFLVTSDATETSALRRAYAALMGLFGG